MNCVVTAGPSFEPLDAVRRLTNFSTGRLGTELANDLVARGHQVTLLVGQGASWGGPRRAHEVEVFTTTADLHQRLERRSGQAVEALFHAAAVADFQVANIWTQDAAGPRAAVARGKLPTRAGKLLVELAPTPKILRHVRAWFPNACLVGWKYEVEGDRAAVLALAAEQLAENHTDACVANGPGYGLGFGLVTGSGAALHCGDAGALYAGLAAWLARAAPPRLGPRP